MSEEKEVKKTTTRKPRTPKTEVEEPKKLSIEDQMQQMMQMMQMQSQMFAAMMQQMQQQQQANVEEDVKDEEPKRESKIKKIERQDKKITKQYLRRKYKDTDIYLTSVIKGSVALEGKNEMYIWENEGECIAVTINDLLAANEAFLNTPWLILDDYENSEEVLEDIIECLGLEDKYEYLYLMKELEDDINKVSIAKVKKAIDNVKHDKNTIIAQISLIVQEKITDEELTNAKTIKEYEKLLHKNFKKD